jgi:hypothetical protein
MAVIVQAPATLDIVAVENDDLTVTLSVTENAVAYNWTGATIITAILDTAGSVLATNFATSTPVNGTLIISLTDTDTSNLGIGSYRYWLSVTKSSATRTWMAGGLTIMEPGIGGNSTSSATLSITTGAATVVISSYSAAGVSVLDTANYYTGTNVETVLAELGQHGARHQAGGIDDISAYYVPIVSSGQGVRTKVSTTYGTGYIFGTAASFGLAGTGTPADIMGAFGVYQQYGSSSPGSSITKTTQGAYFNTLYYGPTTDDSAEGVSSTLFMKDDANSGWSQTKPMTAMEASVRVEGAIQALTGDTGAALGMGARINVLGTARVATAVGFKVSTQNDVGATGTIDKFIGFWQQTASNATTAYGVYTVDGIVSEASLAVGRSAGTAFNVQYGGGTDSSTSLAMVGPTVTTSLGTLSGTYTLTTTPQNLTVNSGATLTAGGGTFMLDSSARTIVTYTAFSGTTVSNATIASGSVATTNGQIMLDPATPNTTALRINAQKGQSKNIFEVFDSSSNLRVRINASGNLVVQGPSVFGSTGAGVITSEINGASGYVRPGLSTGVGSRIWSGSGAPTVSGSAGDVYFRTDGGAGTWLYRCTGTTTWTAVA